MGSAIRVGRKDVYGISRVGTEGVCIGSAIRVGTEDVCIGSAIRVGTEDVCIGSAIRVARVAF